MRLTSVLRAAQPLALCLFAAASASAHAQVNDAAYEAGKALFLKATPACAVCHALKDAGAEGAVGPALDELKPNAARVAKALRDGLGSMPSYRATLSEAQIAALARYVSKASGGGP
jgi:sulfite dehydrogenase